MACSRRGPTPASASTSAPIPQGTARLTILTSRFQTGDLAGQGSATLRVHGQFDVRELFGEIQIPIIEHNFIDELQLRAGYR